MKDGHYTIIYMDGVERRALIRFIYTAEAKVICVIADNEDVILPEVIRCLRPIVDADGEPKRMLVETEIPVSSLWISENPALTVMVDDVDSRMVKFHIHGFPWSGDRGESTSRREDFLRSFRRKS